ncbi:MORN repeat containing protein, partial [Euroglyphus maynei]
MTPSLRSAREESETRSTGSKDFHESQGDIGSNASFLSQDGDISDPTTVEIYHGEWKNDKRSGFGVCDRSDGLRYEGEWYNNKKYGYGVTTFPDGQREEGKYKNNVLVTNIRKKHIFMMRSNKLRERIESAVAEAHRAQQIALQKSDIATSRTATARSKSEQADYAASSGQNDSQMAIIIAKQYGGADLTGQVSIAPLRRRLSDFSLVRRMREGQPPPGTNIFDQQQQQQQQSSS